MFKFKIKYKDKSGDDVEIEITVSMPSLTAKDASLKLGVSSSSIISIKKV